MKYNNELRVIDTQEKAYLLGFLFGDGTITTYVEKTGRVRYLTRISISENDKDLIYQLYELFPFLNIGEFNFSKYNENHVDQFSLAKSSKELYNDLMLNGLYPRKSYENANKLTLPNIGDELIRHFIRGFFDADGSVYTRTNRKNLISVEFSSVSFELLTAINNHLKKIGIYSWRIITKQPQGRGKQVYYILLFNRTAENLKLIKFMYENATICLKRKSDKCLAYKPVDVFTERNMLCSRCGGNKVSKNGIRVNSTRYQCKDCGKGFSIKNKSV